MASKGDYALEQEKYSAELIEKANKEKDGLLKLAKDMSEKELGSYNEEKRIECDDKITDLNVNEKYINEIQEKSKKDIEELKHNFDSNNDNCNENDNNNEQGKIDLNEEENEEDDEIDEEPLNEEETK